MKQLQLLVAMFTVVASAAPAVAQQPAAPRPVPTSAWAPKPVKTPGYVPPQKPWVKLADLKTRHRGQAGWHEVLVDDGRLTAEYVYAAPGTKVGERFHPDTREWFAVVEGEVRVDDCRALRLWGRDKAACVSSLW